MTKQSSYIISRKPESQRGTAQNVDSMGFGLTATQTLENIKKHQRALWGIFSFVAGILIISLTGLAFQIRSLTPINIPPDDSKQIIQRDLRAQFATMAGQIRQLEDTQSAKNIRVVSETELQTATTAISLSISTGDIKAARQGISVLRQQISNWQTELNTKIANTPTESPVAQVTQLSNGVIVPILIYHYTPKDFEQQLQNLLAKGYTGIDLDMLAASLLNGAKLPIKPVIITFDDGFSNQTEAGVILAKYQFKATFYIITSGQASLYCIGAGRRFDQKQSCGDGYLNWDQIKELDKNPLFTIAAHTVDHLNLASQPIEAQRFQINTSKEVLETELGHPIKHFAYPYGSYTATTIGLVRQAGFSTAVSTLPGTVHTPSSILNLHRVRDAYKLP